MEDPMKLFSPIAYVREVNDYSLKARIITCGRPFRCLKFTAPQREIVGDRLCAFIFSHMYVIGLRNNSRRNERHYRRRHFDAP